MDRKKYSRHKNDKSCKNLKGNGDQEIFVLPPNLLEKLGINLGNIQNTQECPTVSMSPTGKKVLFFYV